MRLCRILRSPDVESDGGSPDDEVVTISRAELDELRARAEGGPASRPGPADRPSGREEFAEALKAREAAHSREIAAREQKATELERAYKAALRDRELATALVGKPLVAGAAAQLIKLWRDDFEVVDDDGEIRVLARDGRAVDQAVADGSTAPSSPTSASPRRGAGPGPRGRTARPRRRPPRARRPEDPGRGGPAAVARVGLPAAGLAHSDRVGPSPLILPLRVVPSPVRVADLGPPRRASASRRLPDLAFQRSSPSCRAVICKGSRPRSTTRPRSSTTSMSSRRTGSSIAAPSSRGRPGSRSARPPSRS